MPTGLGSSQDLKDARFYFTKFSFLFHLKNHHSKDVNFKFQLKRSSHLDEANFVYCMELPTSYCVSSIMVTITRHIFINREVSLHVFNDVYMYV